MGKDKILNTLAILICLLVVLSACGDKIIVDNPDYTGEVIEDLGTVIFDFPVPERRVPKDRIHRIDLSIAINPKSLYSGYFIISANVSDLVRSYSFNLQEGEYYYQAGITCVSQGDTCLWDGYPGGQYGAKWTSGTIEIIKDEVLEKTLIFLK